MTKKFKFIVEGGLGGDDHTPSVYTGKRYLPVGTRRTWKDGEYEKVGPGDWRRVVGPRKPYERIGAATKIVKSNAVQKAARSQLADNALPPPPPDSRTPEERKQFTESALDSLPANRDIWGKYSVNDERDTEGFYGERDRFADTLSDDQLDACIFYSKQGDRILNSAARYGTLDKEDERVKALSGALDEAIASNSLKEDATVYRGIKGEWASAFYNNLQPGDTFEDAAYTSTAAGRPFEGDVVIVINLPKGAKAAPIPSAFPAEKEYLLPRNSRFKVVGKGKNMFDRKELTIELVED